MAGLDLAYGHVGKGPANSQGNFAQIDHDAERSIVTSVVQDSLEKLAGGRNEKCSFFDWVRNSYPEYSRTLMHLISNRKILLEAIKMCGTEDIEGALENEAIASLQRVLAVSAVTYFNLIVKIEVENPGINVKDSAKLFSPIDKLYKQKLIDDSVYRDAEILTDKSSALLETNAPEFIEISRHLDILTNQQNLSNHKSIELFLSLVRKSNLPNRPKVQFLEELLKNFNEKLPADISSARQFARLKQQIEELLLAYRK